MFICLNVEWVVQVFVDCIYDENQEYCFVVIGYDQCFFFLEFVWWVVEVFVGNDIVVRIIDWFVLILMIMWIVWDIGCVYGMVVIVFYNFVIYNGFKVFMEGGCDVKVEIIEFIQYCVNFISLKDIRCMYCIDVFCDGVIEVQILMNWYIDVIFDYVDLEVICYVYFKVVFDFMFGVFCICFQIIFMMVWCDVDIIYECCDIFFGGCFFFLNL